MSYAESADKLNPKSLDLNRAIDSLREELEAVNWYQQRIDATKSEELKKLLEHNRDEEKEHAAMLIEWLRRNDQAFAKELKDNVFTDKELSEHQ